MAKMLNCILRHSRWTRLTSSIAHSMELQTNDDGHWTRCEGGADAPPSQQRSRASSKIYATVPYSSSVIISSSGPPTQKQQSPSKRCSQTTTVTLPKSHNSMRISKRLKTHDSHTVMQRLPPALVYRATATSAAVWKSNGTSAGGAAAAAAVTVLMSPMSSSPIRLDFLVVHPIQAYLTL
jgi:hypothetical protein